MQGGAQLASGLDAGILMKKRAYLGLGSNLGGPEAQLKLALSRIDAVTGIGVRAISRFYRSAPMGPPDQPEYCNAVCSVDTELSPRELLTILIDIEREAGRERGGPRWGPRLLDLDLLHMDGVALNEPGLNLPHPGLMHRNFVLVPLVEIAPGLSIPGLGDVTAAAQHCSRKGLSPWMATLHSGA